MGNYCTDIGTETRKLQKAIINKTLNYCKPTITKNNFNTSSSKLVQK
jgi:hypothetical protein